MVKAGDNVHNPRCLRIKKNPARIDNSLDTWGPNFGSSRVISDNHTIKNTVFNLHKHTMHVYQISVPNVRLIFYLANYTTERNQFSRKYTQKYNHRSTQTRKYYEPRIDVQC